MSSSSRRALVIVVVVMAAIGGALLGRWSEDDPDVVVEPVSDVPSSGTRYESSLGDAVTVLADARALELERLRAAAGPDAQVTTIGALAAAYSAAAADLSRMDPPAPVEGSHVASMTALREVAQAYRRLAAAAADGNRGGYAGARAVVRRAETDSARQLAATLTALEQPS